MLSEALALSSPALLLPGAVLPDEAPALDFLSAFWAALAFSNSTACSSVTVFGSESCIVKMEVSVLCLSWPCRICLSLLDTSLRLLSHFDTQGVAALP